MAVTVKSVQLKNTAHINLTCRFLAALPLAHLLKVDIEGCILSRVHGASTALSQRASAWPVPAHYVPLGTVVGIGMVSVPGAQHTWKRAHLK